MRTEAFFSDTSEAYCIPSEPEAGQKLKIRFRISGEDQPEVFLVRPDTGDEIPMTEEGQEPRFRYYSCELTMP